MNHFQEVYIAERLGSITWLAEEAGVAVNEDSLIAQEAAACGAYELGLLPTIGSEIEISWAARFPTTVERFLGPIDATGRPQRLFREISGDDQMALLEACEQEDIWRESYEATELSGIPRDHDAYWEFAHRPIFNWRSLTEEVGLLMKLDLIPGGFQHPMHVTLGRLNPDEESAYLLRAGMELAGGSPERILAGVGLAKNIRWADKGIGGVEWRPDISVDMDLDSSKTRPTRGIESRTLMAASPNQVARVLSTGQMLGAMLLGRQDGRPPSMSEFWPPFQEAMHDLWTQKGLPFWWENPSRDAEPWMIWAECLEARDTPGTPEHEMLELMNELTVSASEALAELVPNGELLVLER